MKRLLEDVALVVGVLVLVMWLAQGIPAQVGINMPAGEQWTVGFDIETKKIKKELPIKTLVESAPVLLYFGQSGQPLFITLTNVKGEPHGAFYVAGLRLHYDGSGVVSRYVSWNNVVLRSVDLPRTEFRVYGVEY
mgnify:CR=1 FL=1